MKGKGEDEQKKKYKNILFCSLLLLILFFIFIQLFVVNKAIVKLKMVLVIFFLFFLKKPFWVKRDFWHQEAVGRSRWKALNIILILYYNYSYLCYIILLYVYHTCNISRIQCSKIRQTLLVLKNISASVKIWVL